MSCPRAWLVVASICLSGSPLCAQSPVPSPTPGAGGRTISGELIRVDASRHSLSVRSGSRELDVLVDEAKARIVSAGRSLRFEELRPGDRIFVACLDDDAGLCHASLVKAGPSRYAAPTPAASPKP